MRMGVNVKSQYQHDCLSLQNDVMMNTRKKLIASSISQLPAMMICRVHSSYTRNQLHSYPKDFLDAITFLLTLYIGVTFLGV